MAQSDTSTGGDGPQLAPGMFPEDFDVSQRGDVVIGIGVAIYYKRRRPEKYELAGRLINEGL